MKARTIRVENGNTGRMEGKQPCLCGNCRGEREPLFPGHPDRHDAAAGDREEIAVDLEIRTEVTR